MECKACVGKGTLSKSSLGCGGEWVESPLTHWCCTKHKQKTQGPATGTFRHTSLRCPYFPLFSPAQPHLSQFLIAVGKYLNCWKYKIWNNPSSRGGVEGIEWSLKVRLKLSYPHISKTIKDRSVFTKDGVSVKRKSSLWSSYIEVWCHSILCPSYILNPFHTRHYSKPSQYIFLWFPTTLFT